MRYILDFVGMILESLGVCITCSAACGTGHHGRQSARKRADGTTAYTVQIRQEEQGVIVHTEAPSFTSKALSGTALSCSMSAQAALSFAAAQMTLGRTEMNGASHGNTTCIFRPSD